MSDIEVLWLDDDSPKSIKAIDGVRVVTAQTCEQAEALLSSGKAKPDWIVVDLIVPQGNWGKPFRRIPGLHYIKHLRNEYGNRFRILALSIVMTPEMKQMSIEAGAVDAYAKDSTSWVGLIRDLRGRAAHGD